MIEINQKVESGGVKQRWTDKLGWCRKEIDILRLSRNVERQEMFLSLYVCLLTSAN